MHLRGASVRGVLTPHGGKKPPLSKTSITSQARRALCLPFIAGEPTLNQATWPVFNFVSNHLGL